MESAASSANLSQTDPPKISSASSEDQRGNSNSKHIRLMKARMKMDNPISASSRMNYEHFIKHIERHNSSDHVAASDPTGNRTRPHLAHDLHYLSHSVYPTRSIGIHDNAKIGIFYSTKAVFQLMFNFISPKMIARYGHHTSQLIASLALFLASVLFSFGSSFSILFVARSIHGMASSMISISGTSKIASILPEDRERCKALGLTYGAAAIGILIGYPYGAIMYYLVGKKTTFFLISILVTMIIVAQWRSWQHHEPYGCNHNDMPIVDLLCNKQILMAIGALFFTTIITAVLESNLPLWLLEHDRASEMQLATVFLPDSIGYIMGTHGMGFKGHFIGKWNAAIASLISASISTFMIPWTSNIFHLLLPQFIIGLSIGITDAAMAAQLACQVDRHHNSLYETVYSLSQIAVCLAYILGPLLSAVAVTFLGFSDVLRSLSVVVFIYALTCCYMHRFSSHKFTELGEHEATIKYSSEKFSYKTLDEY